MFRENVPVNLCLGLCGLEILWVFVLLVVGLVVQVAYLSCSGLIRGIQYHMVRGRNLKRIIVGHSNLAGMCYLFVCR